MDEIKVTKNVIINKPGGTASKNAVSYKIALPIEMAKRLGVTPEDRTVTLTMRGDAITLRKKGSGGME